MKLSIDRLWLVLAVLLPALIALLVPLPAVDLAYQVRAGDEILRTGALPGVDTYTFTIAGTPWTDQQWLAQVLLAAGYRLGGWELLVVLRAASWPRRLGCWRDRDPPRRRRTDSRRAVADRLRAGGARAWRSDPSCSVSSCSRSCCCSRRRGFARPRAWWFAPVLVVALWANLHGSFVLAPLLLGYVWLDDLVRGRPATASLIVLLAGTAATLANPFGPDAWSYAAGIGSSPVITQQVSEWQRTTPFTVPGFCSMHPRWRRWPSPGGGVPCCVGRTGCGWRACSRSGSGPSAGIAWWPFGAVYAIAPAVGFSPWGIQHVSAARPSLVAALSPRRLAWRSWRHCPGGGRRTR